MRLLLDTHALAWSILDEARLSARASFEITASGAEVFVSVASAWEIAIKVGLGKWPEADRLLSDFEQEIAKPYFRLLPITVAHVRSAGLIASPHRDPFDRLLAAQASIEGLTLVSADQRIATLGAPCNW